MDIKKILNLQLYYSQERNMENYYKQKFLKNFEENITVTQFYWMKFIIGILFIWKLLSRDFSNLQLWPTSVLSGYPIDIYQNGYILLTALPIIFDLVTFHFIHWFNIYLNLEFAQFSAICLSAAFIISPISVTRLIGIFTYINLMYLWGYVFRLGQDIDAVFLLFGSLFVFCFLRPERTTVYFQELRVGVVSIFVIYYFFSGFNKIVDLDYLQWFEFDIVALNEQYTMMFKVEKAYWWPKFPNWTTDFNLILSLFGAIITYVIHITAPTLLFDNGVKKLLFYIIFYVSFHFLTIYVGIFFHMNFFAWLILIPFYKLRNFKN